MGLTRPQFVAWLKERGLAVEYDRLRNYEKGFNVPIDIGKALVNAIPWLKLDYLYLGRVGTAELQRVDEIDLSKVVTD
jgi:hypothetical protein